MFPVSEAIKLRSSLLAPTSGSFLLWPEAPSTGITERGSWISWLTSLFLIIFTSFYIHSLWRATRCICWLKRLSTAHIFKLTRFAVYSFSNLQWESSQSRSRWSNPSPLNGMQLGPDRVAAGSINSWVFWNAVFNEDGSLPGVGINQEQPWLRLDRAATCISGHVTPLLMPIKALKTAPSLMPELASRWFIPVGTINVGKAPACLNAHLRVISISDT